VNETACRLVEEAKRFFRAMSRAPGPLRVLTILLAISLAAPQRAHAYIDPASGSIVFQVLVAGVLGALLTMRRWWANIFRMARALLSRVVGR
jgi:hypothetical protein